MNTYKNYFLFIFILLNPKLSISETVENSDNNDTILIFSIPKAGTHLLFKCVNLLTDKPIKFVIEYNSYNSWHLLCPNALDAKTIVAGHCFYIKENINLISDKKNIKGLFIYRDPRDQIVSHAYFMQKLYKTKENNSNLDELISYLIKDGRLYYWNAAIGINAFYRLYLPWKNHPSFYTVKFEDLVGPNGGGTIEAQRKEITNIANYLGLNLSAEKIDDVTNNLFGGTFTFREGKIGSWKNHFSQQHKKEFKKIAGQLLIDLGYEKNLNW